MATSSQQFENDAEEILPVVTVPYLESLIRNAIPRFNGQGCHTWSHWSGMPYLKSLVSDAIPRVIDQGCHSSSHWSGMPYLESLIRDAIPRVIGQGCHTLSHWSGMPFLESLVRDAIPQVIGQWCHTSSLWSGCHTSSQLRTSVQYTRYPQIAVSWYPGTVLGILQLHKQAQHYYGG